MDEKNYRILDANFNRAKEGLRVCEDIFRFVIEDEKTAKSLKEKRHKLSDVFFSLDVSKCFNSRDSNGDVGRPSTKVEFKRKDLKDVLLANYQRVKESLRVLEEVLKLINVELSQQCKEMRYDIYEDEKRIFEFSQNLSDS